METQTTGDHCGAVCVWPCVHASTAFLFSLICMYHPIRIISVTALNIFNSKDAAGVGEEVSKGLRVPVGAACFPGLPLCQVFDIDWSWR